MDNMFIPYNLVQDKDGSVSPRNFTSHIVPKENETFIEFSKRYEKETSGLKDYEKYMFIPEEQKQKLFKVEITKIPTKLTQSEIYEQLQPQVMFTKYFLEKEDAIKWGTNKIKQQSIALYYSKENTHNRQYRVTYNIIHGIDNVISKNAINGKIV